MLTKLVRVLVVKIVLTVLVQLKLFNFFINTYFFKSWFGIWSLNLLFVFFVVFRLRKYVLKIMKPSIRKFHGFQKLRFLFFNIDLNVWLYFRIFHKILNGWTGLRRKYQTWSHKFCHFLRIFLVYFTILSFEYLFVKLFQTVCCKRRR